MAPGFKSSSTSSNQANETGGTILTSKQPVTGREAVVAALTAAQSAMLFLHINADGDSVGSTLSLAHALKKRGVKCHLVYGDKFPEPYRFLPGAQWLRHWTEVPADLHVDVAILPDCSGIDRVGDAGQLLGKADLIVNIDHHPTNNGFGDVYWVDPSRSCVGEMVLEVIDVLSVPLDREIALCIYTAIVTDTGSFAYESTTAVTHRYAARLLETGGIKPNWVAQQLYGNTSREALRLLSEALQTVSFSADGRVGWIVISAEARRRHGAGPHDAEGLVSYPRNVAGVEVAISFYEEDDGSVRVGFRSNRWADVAQLAANFGGGGHRRAAGCRLPGPLAEVVREVVTYVEGQVAGGPDPEGTAG